MTDDYYAPASVAARQKLSAKDRRPASSSSSSSSSSSPASSSSSSSPASSSSPSSSSKSTPDAARPVRSGSTRSRSRKRRRSRVPSSARSGFRSATRPARGLAASGWQLATYALGLVILYRLVSNPRATTAVVSAPLRLVESLASSDALIPYRTEV